MDNENLKSLLENLSAGNISVHDALHQINSPGPQTIANLGHARVDLDRGRRRGISEVIYCSGKTAPQIVEIARTLDFAGQNVLCTRISPENALAVTSEITGTVHHPAARIVCKINENLPPGHGPIAVVTAGTTDIPVAEEAALCLEAWGEEVHRYNDVGVAGVHRLLAIKKELNQAAVVISVAGMEAALTSVVAGLVSAPVIAVPTSVGYGASFGGLAALLGVLNSCSGGIGVMNIDNGFGAALLARMINRVGMKGTASK